MKLWTLSPQIVLLYSKVHSEVWLFPFFRQVVVLYDYKAQRSDELDLFAGDEIVVLFRDTENWWMGELQDGQQGFFPANYVTAEGKVWLFMMCWLILHNTSSIA